MSAAIDENATRRRRKRRRFHVSLAVLLAAVAGFLEWRRSAGVPTIRPRATLKHDRATLTWFTDSNYEQMGPALAFAPDGSKLATAGEEGLIRVWDASSGRLLQSIPFKTPPAPGKAMMPGWKGKREWLGFADDGKTLIVEEHGSIPLLWQTKRDGTPKLLDPRIDLPGRADPSKPLQSVATFYDLATGQAVGAPVVLPGRVAKKEGSRLVLGPADPGADGRLRLWDAAIRREPNGHWARLPSVGPVFIAPDGRTYTTGSSGNVELHDAATGKILHHIGSGIFRAETFAFTPDGRTFAAAGWDGVAAVLDLPTGKIQSFSTPKNNRTPLAISPDGRFLATIGGRKSNELPKWFESLPNTLRRPLWPLIQGDRSSIDHTDTITLWDLAADRPRARLVGHESDLIALRFSPDGRTLASADWSGRVLLWDLAPTRPSPAPAILCATLAVAALFVAFRRERHGPAATGQAPPENG